VFTLFVKADLDGVAKVEFPAQWSLVVQQSGGSETRSIVVDPDNEEEISGSRGKCNFRMKWDAKDKKEAHLVVQKPKNGQDHLSLDNCKLFMPIVAFECRGLDPIEWLLKDGSFRCISESGKVFEDVSLVEGDWFDYDEQSEMPVSLTDIEHKFE